VTTYYFCASGYASQFATRTQLGKPRLAVLLTYAYPKDVQVVVNSTGVFREWVLDSGAYSVASSGKVIDLDKFIEDCACLRGSSGLRGIFALDVIGDHKASRVNADKMWGAGIPAIPTYHFGSPVQALRDLAKDFPRIALGGAARLPIVTRKKWAKACFKEVWPKRVHGLGFGARALLESIPFDSVDATTWVTTTQKYGVWTGLFGRLPPTSGITIDGMEGMIQRLLSIEAQAKVRWRGILREAHEEFTAHELAHLDSEFYNGAVSEVLG